MIHIPTNIKEQAKKYATNIIKGGVTVWEQFNQSKHEAFLAGAEAIQEYRYQELQFINNKEIWDNHICERITLVNENFRFIASGHLEIDEEYIKMCALWVDEDYRGRGYLIKVMNRLESIAKYGYGAEHIYLLVNVNNQRALDVYEKYGFIFHEMAKDKEFVWMVKDIIWNEPIVKTI